MHALSVPFVYQDILRPTDGSEGLAAAVDRLPVDLVFVGPTVGPVSATTAAAASPRKSSASHRSR